MSIRGKGTNVRAYVEGILVFLLMKTLKNEPLFVITYLSVLPFSLFYVCSWLPLLYFHTWLSRTWNILSDGTPDDFSATEQRFLSFFLWHNFHTTIVICSNRLFIDHNGDERSVDTCCFLFQTRLQYITDIRNHQCQIFWLIYCRWEDEATDTDKSYDRK